MRTFKPEKSRIKTTYQVCLYQKANIDQRTSLIENS